MLEVSVHLNVENTITNISQGLITASRETSQVRSSGNLVVSPITYLFMRVIVTTATALIAALSCCLSVLRRRSLIHGGRHSEVFLIRRIEDDLGRRSLILGTQTLGSEQVKNTCFGSGINSIYCMLRHECIFHFQEWLDTIIYAQTT